MFVLVVYVSAMGAREEMSGCRRCVPGYKRSSKMNTGVAVAERVPCLNEEHRGLGQACICSREHVPLT